MCVPLGITEGFCRIVLVDINHKGLHSPASSSDVEPHVSLTAGELPQHSAGIVERAAERRTSPTNVERARRLLKMALLTIVLASIFLQKPPLESQGSFRIVSLWLKF